MNLIMSQYWTTFLNHHISCSFLNYRNETGLIVLTITGTLFKCQVHLALRYTNWGHCKLSLEIDRGPHWWEASALSTTPPLPFSGYMLFLNLFRILDDFGHELEMTDSKLQQTVLKVEKVLRLSDGKMVFPFALGASTLWSS